MLPPQLNRVTGYVFTEHLAPNQKEYFDERVAVFAILKHRASGLDVAFAATHLYHSQDNSLHEAIRGHEINQVIDQRMYFKRCPDSLCWRALGWVT